MDGGSGQTGRETDFKLADFQVGFDQNRFGFDRDGQISDAQPDFQPLVIEIAPHSFGSGQLLQAFQTGQQIGTATLDLTGATTGEDRQVMTFTDLEVLSFGTGLNSNTVLELGYNGWDLTTIGDDGSKDFDLTDLITGNRLDSDGKFIDVSDLSSRFKVGPGSEHNSEADRFTGFFDTDTTPADGLAGTAKSAGEEGLVEVEDVTWSAHREDGEVKFSGLGLALKDTPITAVELQKQLLAGDASTPVLLVKDTAADNL